jgi:hypothetical protein
MTKNVYVFTGLMRAIFLAYRITLDMFDLLDNISDRVQFMKLFIIKLSPVSCCFILSFQCTHFYCNAKNLITETYNTNKYILLKRGMRNYRQSYGGV